MTADALRVAAATGAGVVTGAPRRMLRVEGAALAAGALIASGATHEAWWLIPLTIPLPDLSAVGYLAGTRVGAGVHNAAHSMPVPAIVAAIGWWQHARLAIALGLIWILHIGIDRALAYGLKYAERPQHTHLSEAKRPPAGS
jgi:hypothetical protein